MKGSAQERKKKENKTVPVLYKMHTEFKAHFGDK